MVGTGIRPGHYSHRLVKDHRELVVNISTVDQVKVADHYGMVSRRKVDEFAATILTPAPALKLRTPVIARCPVNLECQAPQAPTLGSQGLPIGQIVAV